MDGQHQKKQFNYPKREDIIQEIKALDDAIQNVSLNLIKCHFDATQKDIEKSFPEYKFIKVKNYNPGSFEVVFEMKIDAINFVKTCYDRKILNRRFFIKMGRQHKQIVENWTCIGQMPNKFNHHKKGKFDKKGQNNKEHKDQKDQKEHKQHKEPREPRQQRQPRQHRQPREHRQPRQQKKTFQKPAPVEKKEQTVVKAQQKNVQKVQAKKQIPNIPKVEAKKQPVKPVEEKPKQEEKKQEKPKPVAQEAKKQTKPVQTKQQAPKASQQTKAEDDGWIKVAPKGKKR